MFQKEQVQLEALPQSTIRDGLKKIVEFWDDPTNDFQPPEESIKAVRILVADLVSSHENRKPDRGHSPPMSVPKGLFDNVEGFKELNDEEA